METEKIVIIGGGPTGLGAARRLQEIGYKDWMLLEKEGHVGGLASSYVDQYNFTWDIGGHVVFSHYDYFDQELTRALGNRWVEHVREAWIWMRDRFIPYPLQNNIRHLPTAELLECLNGIVDACTQRSGGVPVTFGEWIFRNLGPGLARVFMVPYNCKVWACSPQDMSVEWLGERVSTVDLKRILRNVIAQQDDLGWGPNASFRFPLVGGTGAIWTAMADQLNSECLYLQTEVQRIDCRGKRVCLNDGRSLPYDWLISTMPLDVLLDRTEGLPTTEISRPPLAYSGTHVVGVGIEGRVPEALATKCWLYFPEPEVPFYRVTVFSNYSPHNVPPGGPFWSLMSEISESPSKPVSQETVAMQTIDGLKAARLLSPDATIRSVWHKHVRNGYPTPFLGRNRLLDHVEPMLHAQSILSRGRFGAWKYEVGNMDHSFMQGVEAVNHILFGVPETTLQFPSVVNARR